MSGVINMFASGLVYVDGAWLWKHSFSGLYTVKSGYNVAYRWKMSKEGAVGESSNWTNNKAIWNRLWNAKASEGTKLLLWRILHNAVPVRINLARRGMDISRECAICGCPEESIDHLFLECWWAMSLWNSLGIDTCNTRSTNVGDWLWGVLQTGNREVINKILVGLYLVWGNRNQVVHGNRIGDVHVSSYTALCLLSQFNHRRLLGFLEGRPGTNDNGDRWEVYCDGSWSWKERNGGWAAAIFKNGIIMECKADFSRQMVTGLETEVNAIVMGMQLAEGYRCNSVTVYSDCISAISFFQRGGGSEGGPVQALSQGHKLLKDRPGWSLRHVRRIDNGVADSLASKARREQWLWENAGAVPRLVAKFIETGRYALRVTLEA